MNPWEGVNTKDANASKKLPNCRVLFCAFSILQLCKDGRQPCSQTQDPTPSDMIDGKIWRAVFCIHHFVFFTFSPSYGIVQEHTLTSEKNIERVQNCPDITIFYLCCYATYCLLSFNKYSIQMTILFTTSRTDSTDRCTHLRLSSEASRLLSSRH